MTSECLRVFIYNRCERIHVILTGELGAVVDMEIA